MQIEQGEGGGGGRGIFDHVNKTTKGDTFRHDDNLCFIHRHHTGRLPVVLFAKFRTL